MAISTKLRHSVALIFVALSYKVAFHDFNEADIAVIGNSFIFRSLQASLTTMLVSIGYILRRLNGLNDFKDFDGFVIILLAFSGLYFETMMTIVSFDNNYKAERQSILYTNILNYYTIPPKAVALCSIISETIENLKNICT